MSPTPRPAGATLPPTALKASPTYRQDGAERILGISLEWTVGRNNGSGLPGDWTEGKNGDYPRQYEVELNGGEFVQTVVIGFNSLPSWGTYWNLARTHWLSLGPAATGRHSVRIRAELGGGWSEWTEPAEADLAGAEAYRNPYSESGSPARTADDSPAGSADGAPRHGTVYHPLSRTYRALVRKEQDPVCQAAYQQVDNPGDWAAVVPAVTADNKAWNGQYLEYRKYLAADEPVVPSAGRKEFRGLALRPGDVAGADWPVDRLDTAGGELTLTYGYTQPHTGWTWTHQWFVTRDGWRPEDGISWDTLDPVPFLVDLYGGDDVPAPEQPLNRVETRTLRTVPRKSGRHALVNIWGGHGGHGGWGEYFVSVCDVRFG
ncbi:lytic polysaccharide monooxygenase [Kitasatospora cinereorecta]|uniref:Lytic polysaccharide monooxygenase n=1 Tax=Kitasatospora cinereorecta TaxID=285560 RepID=A0ABW0VAM9_9ACTN